jgi:chaperonin GroES
MEISSAEKLKIIGRDVVEEESRSPTALKTKARLNKLMSSQNIVEMLEDEEIEKIRCIVTEDYENDLGTMDEWMQHVEKGMKLNTFDSKSNSWPFPGAANFKTPRIVAVSLQFSDRACAELINRDDICKGHIFGKDNEGKKMEVANRKSTATNHVILRKMKGWKKNKRKLLYLLPNFGTCFTRTYFDPMENKPKCKIIPFGSFIVNNTISDESEIPRFSECEEIKSTDVIKNQACGYWSQNDDHKESLSESDEQDSIKIIEQYNWFDLDGDGIEEPYLVTMSHSSRCIYRIQALYNESSVWIADPNDLRDRMTLEEYRQTKRTIKEGERNPYSSYSVCHIEARHGITKYGYIKDPNGGYLDVGNYYLMSSLAAAVNKLTNQIMNGVDLSIRGGGWLSSEWNKESGDHEISMQDWSKTSIPAGQLQQSVFPYPIKDPPPIAFEALQYVIGEIENLFSSYDLSKLVSANTPAATMLATIQKQESQQGAIINSVYESQTEELDILQMIMSSTMKDQEYQRITGDDEASINQDFKDDASRVIPTANPESSSKTQRTQKAQSELPLFDNYMALNQPEKAEMVLENYLKSICSDLSDRIYPELTDEQKQQQEQIKQQKQQEAQAKAEEERQAQMNAMESLADLQASQAAEKRANAQTKIDKTYAEIRKLKSESILNLEKAESEEVKNKIDIYGALKDDGAGQRGSDRVAENSN